MTFWEVAGYVGVGLVALAVVLTFVTALMSKAGRDAMAVIGVRVADALVAYFERWLSEPHIITRHLQKRRLGSVTSRWWEAK